VILKLHRGNPCSVRENGAKLFLRFGKAVHG
jgi:hypothetical protein